MARLGKIFTRTRTRTAPTLALLFALSFASVVAAELAYTGPRDMGEMGAPPRSETSGLAISRRNPDMLWTHDDSGGAAALYAVGTDGRARGTLQIGGVTNEDWEDIASAELDGKPWLLIGDIGDNDAKRKSILVHFVPEPAAEELAGAKQIAERPTATFRLTYEDGPRDCESLAIDPTERALYLLTKREDVPRLYRAELPAGPLKSADLKLRFVGFVPHIPAPTALEAAIKGRLGKQRRRPCAMDFAADGSAAVVLTYGDTLLFPRKGKEPWAETLAREPIALSQHGLPQAEGACFSKDGSAIYVASEIMTTLLRYDRK
ncbi:MAG: hypothetical protein V4773_24805 [Verrucomicrobiota bacterium]